MGALPFSRCLRVGGAVPPTSGQLELFAGYNSLIPSQTTYPVLVPWSLQRFQQTQDLHFVTFSCYRRQAGLASPRARRIFETELERARLWYGFFVSGYVVMPEHVHLLMSEPERKSLS